jgi:hypothetical protein
MQQTALRISCPDRTRPICSFLHGLRTEYVRFPRTDRREIRRKKRDGTEHLCARKPRRSQEVNAKKRRRLAPTDDNYRCVASQRPRQGGIGNRREAKRRFVRLLALEIGLTLFDEGAQAFGAVFGLEAADLLFDFVLKRLG